MSHHFTADFTVPPSGKEPVSKKLQQKSELTPSAKRREAEKLEIDNKQMEWRLNQIKQAMIKEKEQRGKQGFIWKSGKSGQLESYARNILGRTVSAKNTTEDGSPKQRKSPTGGGTKSAPKAGTRVRTLKDEPLDLPKRSSRAKDLIQKLKSPPLQSQSSEGRSDGDSHVAANMENWISVAADRNTNDIMELQSDTSGNLPLSSIQAIDPTAVGVYFVKWGRKRLLMAVDGIIRRPKVGWGSEVYFPYAGRFLPEMALKPEPPSFKNLSNSPAPHKTTPRQGIKSIESPKVTGGALLQGSFNEEENSASFQKALAEWRQNKRKDSDMPESGHNTSQRERRMEMSVHVAQCTPPPFEVKFSEMTTLSYMERVLLDKHRKAEVPSLPTSFIDRLNNHLDGSMLYEAAEKEVVFTAEEEEEREQLQQIFTPVPEPDQDTVDWRAVEAVIEEVTVDEDYNDMTEECIVIESPPTSPMLSLRSNGSVIIEEIYSMQSKFPMEDDIHGSSTNSEKNNTPTTRGAVPASSGLESLKSMQMDDSTDSESDKPPKLIPQRPSCTKSARAVRPISSRKPEARSRSAQNHEAGGNHRNTGTNITHSPSEVVKRIGQIPINPDAHYHKGLGTFFASVDVKGDDLMNAKMKESQKPTNTSFANDSAYWNPVSSVFSPDIGTREDESLSSLSSDSEAEATRLDDARASAAALLNARPDVRERRDSTEEDERALDDLEWELASRTGNITTDGRISRLIDEWSVESDLDIIDDPGLGSGLSSPDIDRKSLSAPTYSRTENSDFQNIEQMILGDMTDEYDDEDLDM